MKAFQTSAEAVAAQAAAEEACVQFLSLSDEMHRTQRNLEDLASQRSTLLRTMGEVWTWRQVAEQVGLATSRVHHLAFPDGAPPS